MNTSGITLNDVALRTQFGQKRLLSKPSANGSGNLGYFDKQKKRSSSNNHGQKLKGVQESFDNDANQSSSMKKVKKHEFEVEADNKSEESTDDEVSSTIMLSESEKNIDVEYSSPTNIPQNQKLIGKQSQEHKHQKCGFTSNNETSSIGKLEGNDAAKLNLTSEEENLNDMKYRFVFFQ